MRIFKYLAHSRPSCVEDGGYVYDPATGYCIGFGETENEEYEITIEDFEDYYNEIVVEGQTADDFLHEHQASASDLAIQLLQDTDAKTIRVIEDLIETLVTKSIISLSDLPLEAQNKLIVRANLREQI